MCLQFCLSVLVRIPTQPFRELVLFMSFVFSQVSYYCMIHMCMYVFICMHVHVRFYLIHVVFLSIMHFSTFDNLTA